METNGPILLKVSQIAVLFLFVFLSIVCVNLRHAYNIEAWDI